MSRFVVCNICKKYDIPERSVGQHTSSAQHVKKCHAYCVPSKCLDPPSNFTPAFEIETINNIGSSSLADEIDLTNISTLADDCSGLKIKSHARASDSNNSSIDLSAGRRLREGPNNATFPGTDACLTLISNALKMGRNSVDIFFEVAAKMGWSKHIQLVSPKVMGNYRYECIINGVSMGFGEAARMKDAKQKAAKAALVTLREWSDGKDDRSTGMTRAVDSYAKLAKTLLKKYLNKENLTIPSGFAFFFITSSESQKAENATVVAFGTGTRLYGGSDELLDRDYGAVLRDLRALTVAKRAFRAFLWNQLAMIFNYNGLVPEVQGRCNVFFEMRSDGFVHLKTGHRIHIYISRAPDGCATSSMGTRTEPRILDRNDVKRDDGGVLCVSDRTGLLEITRQDNLQLMSLSDKIMLWTHVGLQGSFLSQFMLPVFPYSIQVGCGYSHSDFATALMLRVPLNFFSKIPQVYRPCQAETLEDKMSRDRHCDPFIGRTTELQLDDGPRIATSYNWFLAYNQNSVEVVNSITGLPLVNERVKPSYLKVSRLSKNHQLQKMHQVLLLAVSYFAPKMPKRNHVFRKILDELVEGGSYADIKRASHQYNEVKRHLINEVRYLGVWRRNSKWQQFRWMSMETV